jgi:glycosyltransferase 2 family protein
VTPRRRKLLRIALGLAATGAFLGLFAVKVDMGDAIDRFARLPWWATVAGAAMVFVNLFFMSLRWQLLLRAAGYPLPLRPLVSAAAVGQAGSNILPFRGGDVLRVESIRETGVSGFAVAGSLFAEKVLDGVSLAAWLVIGTTMLGHFEAVFAIGIALLVLSSIGVVVLTLAARHREAVVRFTATIAHGLRPEWRAKVEEAVEHFVRGLGGFTDRRLLGLALLASAGMWLADVVMYAIVGWAYDLDVGFGAYFMLEGVANLALAIPAAAAGIGTFDYLTLVAAQGIAIPTDVATAYVLTVHLLTVVPITLFGLLLLRRAFPRLLRPAQT